MHQKNIGRVFKSHLRSLLFDSLLAVLQEYLCGLYSHDVIINLADDERSES